MQIDYASPATPVEYVCGNCGARGCKLWRQYQTIASDLLCCDCAGKEQEKDVSQIDADGKIPTQFGERCDQIGWRVPAVPDEEGLGYWGYTSVPQAGCDWWYALPTRPEAARSAGREG